MLTQTFSPAAASIVYFLLDTMEPFKVVLLRATVPRCRQGICHLKHPFHVYIDTHKLLGSFSISLSSASNSFESYISSSTYCQMFSHGLEPERVRSSRSTSELSWFCGSSHYCGYIWCNKTLSLYIPKSSVESIIGRFTSLASTLTLPSIAPRHSLPIAQSYTHC